MLAARPLQPDRGTVWVSRLILGCWALSGLAPRLAAQAAPPALLSWAGSVRSAGLHGAGAALVGDAGAVFGNPAGLATLHHVALEGTYRRSRFNTVAATAALGWRIGQFDVGGGVAYLATDSLLALGLVPRPNQRPYETVGVGSLVYRFGLMAVGGSLREVRRSSAAGLERGRSGDLGIAVAVFDILAIGFAAQNLSGNWHHTASLPMPRLLRWGFTMNYTDPQETLRLLSTVEAQWPEGQPARWILGGEAGAVIYGVGVLGRAAFKTRTVGEPKVAWGGTLTLGRFQLDYAYGSRDALGTAAHRAGFRLAL
jgi:hypothetical protein